MGNNGKKSNTRNQQETIKNTSIFSLFTSLSRVMGLVRDGLKAYAFGTGPLSVAFDIAFRLPNILRNLVAEGALSQSFIPLYEEYKKKGKEEASLAAGVVISIVTLILGVITVLAIFLLPVFLPHLLSDLSGNTGFVDLAIDLSRILFPYIILMSLIAIYMAIQYSHGIFWAASFGPALLNMIVIAFFSFYLFISEPQPDTENNAVYWFSWITLSAALIQLLFVVVTVKRRNLSPKIRLRFNHPILHGLYLMMLPAIFSSAVQEIGQLIDIFLATSVSDTIPGAVSALTYAHRLIHLPMGIFGVAIATAALPQFSRLHAENDHPEFQDSLWRSIGLNFFFILPSISGLIIFARPIIGLLFQRGEFDQNSTEITATALRYYAPGILAFSLQKLFMSSLYARKNSRTPAFITVTVLVINVTLSIIFMQTLYHAGLALGSSISAYCGITIYMVILKKENLFHFSKDHIRNLAKIVIVNFILFLLMVKGDQYLRGYSYAVELSVAVPLSVITFFILCQISGLNEWQILKNMLRSGGKKN